MILRSKIAVALFALSAVPVLRANVTLPACIGENMVIQRDRPATLWGWAEPGEKVTVRLGEKVVGVVTGEGDVKPWRISLPPQKAGPVPSISISGTNVISVGNVAAGDVWICSGQSNMVMTLEKGPWCGYGGVNDAAKEAAAADSDLRLFTVENGGTATPWNRPIGTWVPASAESLPKASATAYFFGRALREKLKVPIGLVISAVGGTAVEPWTPMKAFEGDADYAALRAGAEKVRAELGSKGDADRKAFAEWKKRVEEAKAAKQPAPPQPTPQLTPEQTSKVSDCGPILGAGSLYNGKIHPLTPMTVQGAIWYQGESNARRGEHYAHSLTRMIEGWRDAFGQKMPFFIVQLANFGGPAVTEPHLGSFALVREAEEKVANTVPDTGIATAVDIGAARNIHPPNKQEVGRRLAQVTLKKVYGVDVPASGPCYAGARFGEGKATVTFKPGSGALVLKGAGSFEVAGADRKFVPATAVLKNGAVEISAPSVPKPVAVRYAFLNAPECSLFDDRGWPALPFRSDNW